jgi:mono/diheme cytochrome c family protein
MHWYKAYLVVGVLTVVAAGCGGPAASLEPGAAAKTAGAAPAERQQVSNEPAHLNLEDIFPPGNGRDLVLENCQTCHTFVPIVILQKDKDAWNHWKVDHRDRVSNLTEDQFKALSEYLVASFGPHRPVPKLPAELLETWTSY